MTSMRAGTSATKGFVSDADAAINVDEPFINDKELMAGPVSRLGPPLPTSPPMPSKSTEGGDDDDGGGSDGAS